MPPLPVRVLIMAGPMRSMFEPEWRPIPGHPRQEVSDRGLVRDIFSKFEYQLFVKNGQIYVEITGDQGVYVEVKLADILESTFPEEQR